MSRKAKLQKDLLKKIKDKEILVVDDAGSSRDLVRSILSKMELRRVTVTNNGLDALELFNKQEFDLVITDWDMPVMSGIDFVKKIRAKFDKKTLPIIMLTANTKTKLVKTAIAEGVNDYLTKPFKPHDLQLKVLKQLGSRV